jgi:hypothetical protein
MRRNLSKNGMTGVRRRRATLMNADLNLVSNPASVDLAFLPLMSFDFFVGSTPSSPISVAPVALVATGRDSRI